MIDIVIPTIGRESLAVLLASLARSRGPLPNRIFLVDDRRADTAAGAALPLGDLEEKLRELITVLPGRAAGPASARNIGWRASRAKWVAFLDDDVVVDGDWLEKLAADLRDPGVGVAGSTGIVRVPLPGNRRPTDWERNVGGLATAKWITADCAYRRADLLATGGFDERFERAYREDADIALRTIARGRSIVAGTRTIAHPVRPAPWNISIRLQAGNADDVLMDALHGPDWHAGADAPRGVFGDHVATVACGAVALAAGACWLGLTARFAWHRIAPGPRDPREIRTMAVTSVAIPFAAVYHRLRGLGRRRALLADRTRAPHPVAPVVLFDRDGTLIVDVPYNTDPERVVPMPGASAAIDRLRAAGVMTAIVTNQSGVALGHMNPHDVAAITARTEALLGPLGRTFVCAHGPDEGCACRKPAAGLLEAAALALDVRPQDCVMIGDIGSDVEAARRAGSRAILVPTRVTRSEEIEAAPYVAADIEAAVGAVLGGLV